MRVQHPRVECPEQIVTSGAIDVDRDAAGALEGETREWIRASNKGHRGAVGQWPLGRARTGEQIIFIQVQGDSITVARSCAVKHVDGLRVAERVAIGIGAGDREVHHVGRIRVVINRLRIERPAAIGLDRQRAGSCVESNRVRGVGKRQGLRGLTIHGDGNRHDAIGPFDQIPAATDVGSRFNHSGCAIQ